MAFRWQLPSIHGEQGSGLLKIGQRFYDPSLGRWTQQDLQLHLQDPKQWNRYVYVACNPINAVDPSGTDCSAIAAPLGALALGAAAAGEALTSAAEATPPPEVLGLDIAALATEGLGYLAGGLAVVVDAQGPSDTVLGIPCQ